MPFGTFVGIAEQANLKDENGAILSVKGGMLADTTGTVVGACLGTSTVTSFIESASGVPAFITIIVMPFSYSISKGIIFGMISYILCKVASNKIKEIPFVTWIIALVFLVDLVFEAIK